MWTHRRRAAGLCTLVGALLACSDLPGDPVQNDEQPAAGLVLGGYSIFNLELPAGHTDGWARAINEKGDLIVGHSWGPGGGGATAWPIDGTPVLLGTLPGDSESYAYGFNDGGTIVGASWGGSFEAFLYTPAAGMVSIHDPALFAESRANAINDKGVVVGYGRTAAGSWLAFRWTGADGMQLLTYKAEETEARDINDAGTIVGRIIAGNDRGIVWAPKGGTLLGTLGGDYSEASGVNDAGDVVGSSDLADLSRHAFLYRPGPFVTKPADLGPLASSYALGRKISDRGRVVGVDESTGNAITHYNKKWVQLPDHGWTADAFDVSTCGTIVGFAFTPLGNQRAVRWDRDKKTSDCK